MARRSTFFCFLTAFCLLAALLTSTGCSRDPNVRKQKYLESGQRYFDKGQFREAAIQFRNAIQIDDHFADAHYKLALTALKLQQPQSAFQELSTTVQIQPDNYAARLDLANLLVLFHHFTDAKTQLDVLVAKQPSNPEVFVAQANYDAATANIPQAIADMQQAVRLDSSRSDTFLNFGMIEMNGQQWDAAEAHFKKALELSPKSPDALTSLANFYQIRGRFPEAEPLFKRAIEVAPTDPNLRRSLAGFYLAENKPSQAEDVLRQAKKDFPDNRLGFTLLGDYYFSSGQLDKALTEYANLHQGHPKDLEISKNYIQLLILKDHLDEAQKLNDEYIKARPDDLDGQIAKGEIEIRNGKADDAVNTLQAVLKQDPDNAVAHFQQGNAFERLGNVSRAEGEWRNAVRLQPDIVDAHRKLAGIAIYRSDPGALAQEADQIIASQPAAPDGYLLRAIADIDRKQYQSADDFLKRALAKEPNYPAAYVQLGNLRMAEGTPTEAQKAYQQALDLDPNNTDALGGILNVDIQLKQPDAAIAAARVQLAKYPKNVGFHVIMGRLLLEQKNDFAGAEREFKQALDLDGKNVEARLKLGFAQDQSGAHDQALQTYLDGAIANPREVTFHLLAGGIYETRQDWKNAQAEYEKALAIQPDNALASNNEAYVMLQQGGNLDIALKLAQTGHRLLPDAPATADTLGWAFYQKQIYSSAVSLLKEAVKKQPDNPTYNYHLGLAYARSGQVKLGNQQLERVVKLKPDFPNLNELRQALAEAKG